MSSPFSLFFLGISLKIKRIKLKAKFALWILWFKDLKKIVLFLSLNRKPTGELLYSFIFKEIKLQRKKRNETYNPISYGRRCWSEYEATKHTKFPVSNSIIRMRKVALFCLFLKNTHECETQVWIFGNKTNYGHFSHKYNILFYCQL